MNTIGCSPDAAQGRICPIEGPHGPQTDSDSVIGHAFRQGDWAQHRLDPRGRQLRHPGHLLGDHAMAHPREPCDATFGTKELVRTAPTAAVASGGP